MGTELTPMEELRAQQLANSERLKRVEDEVKEQRKLLQKIGAAVLVIAGLNGSEVLGPLFKSFLGLP